MSWKYTHPVNIGILGFPLLCDLRDPIVIIGTPFCMQTADDPHDAYDRQILSVVSSFNEFIRLVFNLNHFSFLPFISVNCVYIYDKLIVGPYHLKLLCDGWNSSQHCAPHRRFSHLATVPTQLPRWVIAFSILFVLRVWTPHLWTW